MPRRPPRRKLGLDRSRHKSLTGGENQFKVEETIAEVESPSDSPVLERGPKVRMPGVAPVLGLSSPGVRKPSVPQPGQARVPSPTSTVNTLELIGSPVSSRPSRKITALSYSFQTSRLNYLSSVMTASQT